MNSKRQAKVKRSHIFKLAFVVAVNKILKISSDQTKTRDLRGTIESFNCITTSCPIYG